MLPSEPPSIPPPYVVAIDPGHGGSDPGALGLDGLVEKDLTLDVSNRLAALLRADGVTVVMTRTTDASVSIQQRSDIANAAHADVFLPIYFNSWTTPVPDGSVVLYPYARDIPFATDISQAVTNYIGPDGDNDGGIVLRNDWWLQPTMPVATVESLFISNPHDAALLTKASFRQGLADALRNGVETYLPGIRQRLQEVGAVTPAKLLPASGPLAGPPAVHGTSSANGEMGSTAKTAATTGGTPAALRVSEVAGAPGSGPARGPPPATPDRPGRLRSGRRLDLGPERRPPPPDPAATAAADPRARPHRGRRSRQDAAAPRMSIPSRSVGASGTELCRPAKESCRTICSRSPFEVRGRAVKPVRRPSMDELPL